MKIFSNTKIEEYESPAGIWNKVVTIDNTRNGYILLSAGLMMAFTSYFLTIRLFGIIGSIFLLIASALIINSKEVIHYRWETY